MPTSPGVGGSLACLPSSPQGRRGAYPEASPGLSFLVAPRPPPRPVVSWVWPLTPALCGLHALLAQSSERWQCAEMVTGPALCPIPVLSAVHLGSGERGWRGSS